ncbi:hypothetical protein MOQ_001613 [Trypanosoma cruzi marinkellei]|uniref:Uncharacterized protein n=1 Tax=Trypanosoma cruzi marinkellei TaxID=85056 RepID=K2NFW2_TRYCR|nr:hypothetical protein MOQ_001613 [Trypanosoma cruzi marinkellei]
MHHALARDGYVKTWARCFTLSADDFPLFGRILCFRKFSEGTPPPRSKAGQVATHEFFFVFAETFRRASSGPHARCPGPLVVGGWRAGNGSRPRSSHVRASPPRWRKPGQQRGKRKKKPTYQQPLPQARPERSVSFFAPGLPQDGLRSHAAGLIFLPKLAPGSVVWGRPISVRAWLAGRGGWLFRRAVLLRLPLSHRSVESGQPIGE